VHVVYHARNASHASFKVVFDFMLPYPEDSPSALPQSTEVPLIAFSVLLYLFLPEGRQLVPPKGKSESMPEVAIDENRNTMAREHNVWFPRQIGDMFSKTVAASMKLATKNALNVCIAISHPRHTVPTLLGCKIIRH
jgi:hypothetical protein